MNRLIPIVYKGNSYRFEVDEDFSVVGLTFVRGAKCSPPQPISMEEVPQEVDELLFQALRRITRLNR